MGYSCAAKASFVLDAIVAIMDRDCGMKSSNGLPNGFWERGREKADGAIVGTVWKTVRKLSDDERKIEAARIGGGCQPDWIGDPARKAGSFRIEASGKITRFPQLSKSQKGEAEAHGAMRYEQTYSRGIVQVETRKGV